ncbi:glycosyltransferase family protein [Aeromonas veronii]|uniref:hypothetical protein n=1 Tax=Aeromonas veronii TaxID=654 RepID=UPI002B46A0AF|nr:hypothetical protein [Aeromonas veronii]
MNQNRFSPVVLFVFARPDHTKKTVDALLANPEACNTDLIVYADAARSEKDVAAVEAVREIFSDLRGFKSVTIHLREKNYGLAKNIMEGVTQVTEMYGRAIILEDDIVTSPAFLNYMNAALDKYENIKEVWHISGWNYPIKSNENLPETFFWRTMNCWGWATWADRWQHFKKNPDELVNSWSSDDVKRFNLDSSHDFWAQVVANHEGKLNTWAIFWYATIFVHQGLCLNPTRSFVANIGNDGSGENCGAEDIYKTSLANIFHQQWPTELTENVAVVELIRAFYKSLKPSLLRRILGRIKRVFI